MEGLSVVFFWLIALLFIVALGLVQYVLIPWGLLRAFFRSDWAPQALKHGVAWTLRVLVLLLIGFVSWSWYQHWQARQQASAQRHWPPIRLTAQQPGVLPFPLGRGRIEFARWGAAPQLIVSGDLAVEGRLRATFTASSDLGSYYKTNRVQVSTEKEWVRQATGQTVYDPGSRRVSGSLHCVLASGKYLSISFPPTPVSR